MINKALSTLVISLILKMLRSHTLFSSWTWLLYGDCIKGTRDNFKIQVNFMKPTFLRSLRQGEAYDKK